jgi:hypothetical protein
MTKAEDFAAALALIEEHFPGWGWKLNICSYLYPVLELTGKINIHIDNKPTAVEAVQSAVEGISLLRYQDELAKRSNEIPLD